MTRAYSTPAQRKGSGQGAFQPAATPAVQKVLSSPGRPLDASDRAFLEPRFGHDFSRVRIHDDAQAAESARAVNARAYTVGEHVAFASGQRADTAEGRKLLAHELTHVIQQRAGSGAIAGSQAAFEGQADLAAGLVTGPGRTAAIDPLPAGPGLQAKPAAATETSPELRFEMILSVGAELEADLARSALDSFRKMSPPQQKQAFERHFATLGIKRLLRAVTAEDAAGPFMRETTQLLRWVQEAETRIASGKSDEEMAEAQARHLEAEAVKTARASSPSPSPQAPSPAELDKALKENVGKISVQASTSKRWQSMKQPERNRWIEDGNKVIAAMVDHAAKKHPEIKLDASRFRLAFEDVEKRGEGVMAFSESDGKGGSRAGIGFVFVETAKVDPAYMFEVVVHEIFGHPEFTTGETNYHFQLYEKAAAKVPGYKKPREGTEERRKEYDSYYYHESEIYSILRALPYHTPVKPEDQKEGVAILAHPRDEVSRYLLKMQEGWDEKLLVALLKGFYERLFLDPRLTPAAVQAFRDAVRANFTEDQAAKIVGPRPPVPALGPPQIVPERPKFGPLFVGH